MRMPKGAESVKAAQKCVEATPPKGTESIHSVPPSNTESHQPLYSEKIFMQRISKNWEGFNSQIKNWQSKKGYKKLNSKIYGKRPTLNPKIPENSPRAK